MNKIKSIYIVWKNYQSRVLTMQKKMGYTSYFFSNYFNEKILRPLDYIIKSIRTMILLYKEKPNVIWIQLPPTPLLYIVFIYKLVNPKVVIISDCHNAMLRKPWIKTPLAVTLLNKSNIIVVHNESLLDQIESLKIESDKCVVLEDRSDGYYEVKLSNENVFGCQERKTVIFPASFSIDEPIIELIEAAKINKDIDFYITGNYRRSNIISKIEIPDNIHLTGYLDNESYYNLLKNVDVVLGLTYYDGIQLSVANEAVAFNKCMVLSNTKTLRSLFYKGAIYVKTTPESIATGIKDAIKNKDILVQQVIELKEERLRKWEKQAINLKRMILEEHNNK